MLESNRHLVKNLCLVLFLGIILVMMGCSAKSSDTAMTDGQQTLKIRGKVKVVESDIGLLVIDGKAESINISFNEKVVMRGFESLTDLRAGNPVEVLYWQDNLGNYAVSIKKLPKGSCDS